MQLASSQLPDHLKRGIKPLYTLHGDEPLLVQEFADALRTAARAQGYTERTVHTAAGAHFLSASAATATNRFACSTTEASAHAGQPARL